MPLILSYRASSKAVSKYSDRMEYWPPFFAAWGSSERTGCRCRRTTSTCRGLSRYFSSCLSGMAIPYAPVSVWQATMVASCTPSMSSIRPTRSFFCSRRTS